MVEVQRIILELLGMVSQHNTLAEQMLKIVQSIREIREDATCLGYFGTFQSRVANHQQGITPQLEHSYYDWSLPSESFGFQQMMGINQHDYFLFQEDGWLAHGIYHLDIGMPILPLCDCLSSLYHTDTSKPQARLHLSSQYLAESTCRDHSCCTIRWVLLLLQEWTCQFPSLTWEFQRRPGCYLSQVFRIQFTLEPSTKKGLWNWLVRHPLPYEKQLKRCYLWGERPPGFYSRSILDFLTCLDCHPNLTLAELISQGYFSGEVDSAGLAQWEKDYLWHRRREYFLIAARFQEQITQSKLEFGELFLEWEILLRVSRDLFRHIMEFI